MDPHAPAAPAAAHHEPQLGFKDYLNVFILLCIFTAVSFVVNAFLHENHGMIAAVIIMVVAVIKAFFVVKIFMHLKVDWRKVYGIIVPIVIVSIMMVIVLLPDIVLTWHE